MLTKAGTADNNSGREEGGGGVLAGTRGIFTSLGPCKVPQRAGSCYQP